MKKIRVIIFDWGDTLMRDFGHEGAMCHWEHVELIPGVKTVLSELEKDYTLAVASNAGESDSSLMKKALIRGEIENYFSYFFTSMELGFEKPDLRFFMSIMEKLKFLPQQCIMVGNDYEKDIIPAKSLGMNTILFDENDRYDTGEYSDYKVNKMSDIIDIIRDNF